MTGKTSVYIADANQSVDDAIKPTKVVVIGAHQDDIPIMHPESGSNGKAFMGIIVTDGAGSPSTKGVFKTFSHEEIARLRVLEQNAEAAIGKYPVQFQLGYSSASIGGKPEEPAPEREALTQEIYHILMKADKLEEVYVHNPFDKHPTHNAVTRATIEALRMMPPEKRPQKLIGREVWRGLDWAPEMPTKIHSDVSQHVDSMQRRLDSHGSQLAIKPYTRATQGRLVANIAYGNPHLADNTSAVALGIDMSEFLTNPNLTMEAFTARHIDTFRDELIGRAKAFEPNPPAPTAEPAFQFSAITRGNALLDRVLPRTIPQIRDLIDWQDERLFNAYKELVAAVVAQPDAFESRGQEPLAGDRAIKQMVALLSEGGQPKVAQETVRSLIRIVRQKTTEIMGTGPEF